MYHELTYAQARRRAVRRAAVAVAVVVLAVVLWLAVGAAQASAREQAAVSVRESVLEAAKQCCAVEGSYPASLSRLESEYGLVINHDDYVVNYEWLGGNVLPSVVVTPR